MTRARIAVLVVALLGAFALVFAFGPDSGHEHTPPDSGRVTWASGVFPGNGIDTAAAEKFGTWRGRAVNVAAVFTGATSWSDLETQKWSIERYADFRGRLSIGVPLTFEGTSLAQVTSGAHDDAFRAFAQHLKQLGRGNSDLRLGWEFNGNWEPWSAFDAGQFDGAFRHVAQVLKSVLPTATIDWNGNRGTSQSGHDPFTKLYPGDDVVDVVGLDAYDNIRGIDSPAAFDTWAASSHGLDDWLAFATKHHKKFSIPEWGVTAGGGGDNPAYITGMYDWLHEHSSDIAFEAYFNYPKGGTRNSLTDPVDMPASSTEYRRLWGDGKASEASGR